MKKTPVAVVIALAVLTCGTYIPCWFLARRKSFNRLSGPERLNFIPFAVSLFLITAAISAMIIGVKHTDPITWNTLLVPAMLASAAWLIILVQSFKARTMVQYQKPGLQLSSRMVFLFQVFYLQYHVNRLGKR